MTKKTRMSNDECGLALFRPFRHLSFALRHSSVIRASSFVVHILILGLGFGLPVFAQTNSAANNSVSHFRVDRYLVEGNTILPAATVGAIFTNARFCRQPGRCRRLIARAAT
jgi:hypothetical protein